MLPPLSARAGGRLGLAQEELSDVRVFGVISEVGGRALRDDRLPARVEHDAAVRDGVNARKLVRDDHERDAEAPRERADRRVEPRGGDRVEAGRRLVEKEDARVERESARDRRPLLHAAGELGGHPDRRGQKVHLVELRHGDEVPFLPGQLRELVERQADVFEDRQRTEEGAALIHDAELAQEPQPVLALGLHQVLAVDPDFPGERLVESDHDLEDGALARPRASENDEDLAAADLEVEILLDHPVAVSDCDSAHLDRDRRRAHTCSAFVSTAKIASTTMIMRMPATTARVAESPTALGPSFVCMPRRQPRPATIAPNTIDLLVPTRTSEI